MNSTAKRLNASDRFTLPAHRPSGYALRNQRFQMKESMCISN